MQMCLEAAELFQLENVQKEEENVCPYNYPLPVINDFFGVSRIPLIEGSFQMAEAMENCPAYGKIPVDIDLKNLRVIFLYETLYHAQQCAAFLCSCTHKKRAPENSVLAQMLETFPEETGGCLLSLPVSLWKSHEEVWKQCVENAPSVFLYDDTQSASCDDLLLLLKKIPAKHKFLALPRKQISQEVLRTLSFELNFTVWPVEGTTEEYQVNLFSDILDYYRVSVEQGTDLSKIVERLKVYRGNRFTEGDFMVLVNRMKNLGMTKLNAETLPLWQGHLSEKDPLEKFDQLIGLQEIKNCVKRFLAVKKLKKGKMDHSNLAFSGEPGTCKSVTARLLAEVMAQNGLGSGAFVECGREHLIGGYLGQTSIMIEKVFAKARGGVLFIDEAGALLTAGEDGKDIFAEEAVNALVRHMELQPETTVIFATYPHEMEAFLKLNPGLSSRISKVIHFPSYTPKDLFDILQYLAKEMGYSIPKKSQQTCIGFFEALKKRKGTQFGNGRESRRLLEAAIEEMAVRIAESDAPEKLSHADLKKACSVLLNMEKEPVQKILGFTGG